MGLLEESLKAKGGPRSSNATILVTEWKAPGIFLTKKNNRQRDQFFQFLFVKSYCKFHLCPSPSSSSSSVSRCQPCFYPWTVNRNAFVIRYFFTVLRHVFLCLSLLRFPSGTQPFFPFRFVNSLVISSSIFGRVIFFRHASDPVIGCPWTSRSLCVDHAAETVLTREKCTVIHLVISMLQYNIYSQCFFFWFVWVFFFGVLVIVKSGQKYTNTWAGATAKWSERWTLDRAVRVRGLAVVIALRVRGLASVIALRVRALAVVIPLRFTARLLPFTVPLSNQLYKCLSENWAIWLKYLPCRLTWSFHKFDL